MEKLQILQFIMVCLTFVTTLVASVLGYLIQKDRRKISGLEDRVEELERKAESLSRKLKHGLENLQQYYELEKVIAADRKETHSQFRRYMTSRKIRINRKGFSPKEMENMLHELKS